MTKREKWIAALRSGEYKQGRFQLHKERPNKDHTYCCLGVACLIVGISDEEMGASTGWCADRYKELSEKFEIDSAIYNRLIVMNDHGKTFNEIADYLEDLRDKEI